jgi:hypothetical protein
MKNQPAASGAARPCFSEVKPRRPVKYGEISEVVAGYHMAQLGTPLAYFERGFCAFLDQTLLQTCPAFRAIGARDKRMPKPITDRAYS